MLKKLLAAILTCVMILSASALVSFADDPVVLNEWTEDCSTLTTTSLTNNTADSLYVNRNISSHNTCPYYSYRHLHLSNGWAIIGNSTTDTTFLGKFEIENARGGKTKTDKSLRWKPGSVSNYYIKNSFDGTPIDVSNGEAVGMSFDWYSEAPSLSNFRYAGFTGVVMANVVLSDDTTQDIDIATISGVHVTYKNSKTQDALPETWNNLNMYISKDTINIRACDYLDPISFETSYFKTGCTIKTVNSVSFYLRRDSGNNSTNASFGWDNLKTSELSAMPDSVTSNPMPRYIDFSGYYSTNSNPAEGVNLKFRDGDSSQFSESIIGYQLSENTKAGSAISINIYKDDGTLKSAPKTDISGYLKIGNTVTEVVEGNPLCNLKIAGGSSIPKAESGDKVQFSFDFKIEGNNDASSTSRLLNLDSKFVTGTGAIFNVSGNGTVYDPESPRVPIAKLAYDTWYSVDTVYELTVAGTVANVYLNGKNILTKTVTGEYATAAIDYAQKLTYFSVPDADNENYLTNSACFDNICYQIFKSGVGAFDFNKSADAASNEAIAKADVDFVNGTIFPVAADFTVGDFDALGLTNCTVLNQDDSEPLSSDFLVGKKLVFSGDYGKDVSFTVSGDGGINVTSSSFVTVREELAGAFATSANVGKLLTAKAVNNGADLDVYIAEYQGDRLVGLALGNGITYYKPKTSGNIIKIFVWNDGTLVPTFGTSVSSLDVNS